MSGLKSRTLYASVPLLGLPPLWPVFDFPGCLYCSGVCGLLRALLLNICQRATQVALFASKVLTTALESPILSQDSQGHQSSRHQHLGRRIPSLVWAKFTIVEKLASGCLSLAARVANRRESPLTYLTTISEKKEVKNNADITQPAAAQLTTL